MLCCWTSSSSGLMGSLFSAGLPDGGCAAGARSHRICQCRRRCRCAKARRGIFYPKPCDTAALMRCLRQCAKAGGKSPAAVAAPAPVPAHLPTDVLTRSAYRRMSRVINICVKGILFTIRDGLHRRDNESALSDGASSTPSCTLDAPCDRHCMEPRRRGRQEKIFCGAFSGSTGRPRTANSSPRSPSLFCSRSANKKYGILPENRTASAADRPQTRFTAEK